MKFEEYLELDETGQVLELCNGVEVARRETFDSISALFQLDNFYVEVCYKKNKIILYPFRSTRFLEPYLDAIDISVVHEQLK